ncbi:hypothetical protein [Methylobacterium gnaphalii]|uniref:Uncharacterized protein n=1 Tax=Methylobacterium gnaphalii TaxID=1010610 RepID=A0A512JK66_9HYPH|nr:hypothetical protein [Methylobacterium gnaphalii]GEP10356.1 hypothetical protein MGN01_22010 [Methylobacterium gnaphalii]GJD68515.1 hypothetical protein MMMDOFMJ_1438 [Methylobacterium gnaphalii]GLS51284.1 hypothetical protein GCM10007885_41390 [Methylobacterium gnaphalii]
MKTPYEPPKQPIGGQIFDAVLMLVLVFITLYLPLWLKLAGSGTSTKDYTNPTWQDLGQNATMVEQWTKLGFTPEKAAPIIGTRFDYDFNITALIITFAIIVGYFVFMFVYSNKEYKEVIAEKFSRSNSAR